MTLYCYGDSNAWGWDARLGADRFPATSRWPNIAAALLGCMLRNDSMPGRTIPGGPMIPLLLRAVREFGKDDVLLLMLGTNDYLAGHLAGSLGRLWEPALNALLEEKGMYRDRIFLATPPWQREMTEEQMQAIRESYGNVCRQKGLCFIDAMRPCSLQFDGIHLSEQGQREMGIYLASEIRRQLSSLRPGNA